MPRSGSRSPIESRKKNSFKTIKSLKTTVTGMRINLEPSMKLEPRNQASHPISPTPRHAEEVRDESSKQRRSRRIRES